VVFSQLLNGFGDAASRSQGTRHLSHGGSPSRVRHANESRLAWDSHLATVQLVTPGPHPNLRPRPENQPPTRRLPVLPQLTSEWTVHSLHGRPVRAVLTQSYRFGGLCHGNPIIELASRVLGQASYGPETTTSPTATLSWRPKGPGARHLPCGPQLPSCSPLA
jgi:hypothetical protein